MWAQTWLGRLGQSPDDHDYCSFQIGQSRSVGGGLHALPVAAGGDVCKSVFDMLGEMTERGAHGPA